MIKKILIFSWLSLVLYFPLIGGNLPDKHLHKYKVNTKLSKLFWKCDIHNGYVLIKSGSVFFRDNQPVKGQVVMLMDSIIDKDIDYRLMRLTLQNVLKSDVFFDVVKFPEATFNIVQSKKLSSDKYEITGFLSIKGITNKIQFFVHVIKQNNIIKIISVPFKINRLEWGLKSYSSKSATDDQNFIVSDNIQFKFILYLFPVKVP